MSSYWNPGQWTGFRPRAKPKAATTKSPGTTLAPQTPFDPYAGAQKSVDEMLATMLAAVQREKALAYEQAQREAQMEYQKGQALAEGLKALGISGAVQSAFQNAATAQSGLAQGFSGATRELASAQAAEQARLLSGSGQEGAVRNQGSAMGNVQYGTGGFIPGTELNTIGAAFSADAALQPGFALQFGAINEALRRQRWAEEELPEWTNRVMDVYDKKPGMLQDAYERVDDLLKPTSTRSTSTKNTIRSLANGQLQAFNAQGKPVGKPYGPVRKSKSSEPKATKLQARTLSNGQVQWFNPETGKPVGAPIGPPRAAAKRAAAKGYNLQLKRVNDNYSQWFDPRTGKAVGPRVATPKTPRSTSRADGRPDGMTPTQVRNARAEAYTIAKQWKANGMKDGEGNQVRPQDLLKELINEGAIPFDIAVRQLSKFYKPASRWYSKKSSVKPEKGAVNLPASFRSTHETDGLGWPAVDIMGRPGTPVAAPASGTIVRHGSAQGGQALYLQADDGTMFWIGHVDSMLPVGTRVRRGMTLARISADHARPHVHLAKQAGSSF